MEKLSGIELVVVEDDPTDIELIRRALKKHNIANDIKVLSNGAEALDYLLPNGKALDDIKKCYALGANSYLVKPVVFEKFIEVVAEAGLYWLILNELPKD